MKITDSKIKLTKLTLKWAMLGYGAHWIFEVKLLTQNKSKDWATKF